MTVYTAGRTRRRPSWKRVAVGVLGVLAAVLVASVAAVAWWANGIYGQISEVTPDLQEAKRQLSPTPPLPDEPAVALVIGSDHRFADGGARARSDTLMLVRVDPKTRWISLLSLPRDLQVDIPGVGTDKINAAYTAGGAKLATQTVKQLTGLQIDYLISVNFTGFTRLVDDFGGVYVNVDRFYYHDNQESYEKYDEIDIKPGYQLLRGPDALDFSRYRHTDSDFFRQARQQLFLDAFESRVSRRLSGISLADLPTVKDVVETIAANVQVTGPKGAPGIQTIIDYARLAYSIQGRVVSVPLDAHDAGDASYSYVETTPDAVNRAVFAFTHPERIGKPKDLPERRAAGKKAKRFRPSIPPAEVSLAVLNGNGVTGSADRQVDLLTPFGYVVTNGENADSFEYRQTQVLYRAGYRGAANDVLEVLGYGRAAPVPGNFTHDADLVLVVGADFRPRTAIRPPRAEPDNALPPDIQPDAEANRADFAVAARDMPFPVLYPTVVQTESSFEEFTYDERIRTYRIAAAPGRGKNSMYAVFRMPNTPGAFWGIQQTTFTDAPVLDHPDAERHLDGRTYRFYFNGSHVHLIAIVEDDAAYWVTNTLRDDLTNGEMVAIARSLRPVR